MTTFSKTLVSALLATLVPIGVSAAEVVGTFTTQISEETVGGTVVVRPSIAPAAATYTSARTVSITSTGASRSYYTTDGTNPTCGTGPSYTGAVGTQYSGTFTVSATATVKAIACYLQSSTVHASPVASATYTISAPASSGGGGGGSSGGSRSSSNRTTTTVRSENATSPTTIPSTPTTNTTSQVSFTRDLSSGNSGEDVRRLQQFLNTHGFQVALTGPGSPTNETTLFGAATRTALAAYQAARGIVPAAGVFGPVTRARINAELGSSSPAAVPSTSPTTGVATNGAYGRNLDLGSTGLDVTALQQYLIAKGFSIPAGATGYFGAQTQTALAAFQSARNISPAIGYFGSVTRAYVIANP